VNGSLFIVRCSTPTEVQQVCPPLALAIVADDG
jgi:hypothetical protein